MAELPIVTRRDLLGQACLFCEGGSYRQDSFSLLSGDTVICRICGDVVERWLTKREVLEIQASHGDEKEKS